MSKIILPGDRRFYINRRRYKEIEACATARVEGIYTLRAIKPGVGMRRELTFRNLLTDLGMNALGSSSPAFTRMHLGTGQSTPDVSDTNLSNFGVNISSSSSDGSGVEGPPYYGWCRFKWSSAVGGATGTWTEIGISNQNTNGNLRSRALILDGNNQPTGFPVLADEQFEGTYEFRIYSPTADSEDQVTYGGVQYDVTTRVICANRAGVNATWQVNSLQSTVQGVFRPGGAYYVDAYDGGLGATTALEPQGTRLGAASSRGSYTYTNGDFYLDNWGRWGPADGNGGIKSIRYCLISGAFQIGLDPVLTKLNTEELIWNQRFSWARR